MTRQPCDNIDIRPIGTDNTYDSSTILDDIDIRPIETDNTYDSSTIVDDIDIRHSGKDVFHLF
jgi:hypothetical protein